MTMTFTTVVVTIRDEFPADVPAREALLDAAFGPERYLKTCERLREGRVPAFALTAVDGGGRVVGTVRLWHVTAGPGRPALVLGPLAVDAGMRSHGIGARLMRAALNRAANEGAGAVLLVGDAPYYARFGFTATLAQALWLPGPVDRERFLALELREGFLAGALGLVSPTGEWMPAPDFADLVAAAMLSANDSAEMRQAA